MEIQKKYVNNTIINKPLISVIMPVYNVEKYVHASIDSILGQTFSDFELLVIDNCSTDNTRKIVLEYADKDSRVVPVFNDTNLGLIDSLNIGISLAKGKYIARMDGDDISTLDRFERQLRFIKTYDVDLIGCQGYYFSDDIKQGKPMDFPETDKGCKRFLTRANAIAHPARFGKREIFEKLKYRDIYTSEDYDFLIRAAENGYRLGNIHNRCLYYRDNAEGISGSQGAKQYVIKNYLAKNFRKGHELGMEEFETWQQSIDYAVSLAKVQKQLDRIKEVRQYGRFERLLGLLTNPIWIRQRLLRYRNSLVIFLDRKNKDINNEQNQKTSRNIY